MGLGKTNQNEEKKKTDEEERNSTSKKLLEEIFHCESFISTEKYFLNKIKRYCFRPEKMDTFNYIKIKYISSLKVTFMKVKR